MTGQDQAAPEEIFHLSHACRWILMFDPSAGHLASQFVEIQSQFKPLLAGHPAILLDLQFKRGFRFHAVNNIENVGDSQDPFRFLQGQYAHSFLTFLPFQYFNTSTIVEMLKDARVTLSRNNSPPEFFLVF